MCADCGHYLEVDQSLAMETALSLTDQEGPCSAKNMTFAQTALYIRTLELQWMENQRRIHALERELAMLAVSALPGTGRMAQKAPVPSGNRGLSAAGA